MSPSSAPIQKRKSPPAEVVALYDRWPAMATDGKRKIAEALVEKIVIGEGEIDITFSYLPTSEELCKNQQQLRVVVLILFENPSCRSLPAH